MYISIDLGGTNTRVASSKDAKTIHKIEKFKTKHDLSSQKQKVNDAIQKVIDGEEVEYICLGVPGLVDRKNRIFKKIVNYPELTGHSYETFFDIPTGEANLIVENDAALAGLAEARRNSEAKEHDVVAYLTLSTGVGGIRIQGKKIDMNQGNSEPGHMIIVENGVVDKICGQKGCLHAYLSAAMFKDVYGTAPNKDTDKVIWDDYGMHLSTGIVNLLALWDPDVVVIGGGVGTNNFEFFKDSLFKHLDMQDFFEVPPIIVSDLGDENGVLGGFDLISLRIKDMNNA